jgi:diguanylate cyclase (GGDEF)-like protein
MTDIDTTKPTMARPRKRRPAVALPSLLLCSFCLLLLAVQGWNLWISREIQLSETATATANMARALASQAESSTKIVDTVLADLVERVEHDGLQDVVSERLRQHLVRTANGTAELHGLFIYGAQGEWLGTSLDKPVRGNNADREYFQYHRSHGERALHISAPIRSRSSGVWIIPLSRRLNNPDGSFAGVVLATIRVDFFARFYDSFDVGNSGTILLAIDNGTLLYRRPFQQRLIGSNIADGPVFRFYRQNGPAGTAMLTSKIDKVERLYSYRHLDGFPLVVASAQSKEEILEEWRASSLKMGGLALVLAGMLAWAGSRTIRQIAIQHRLEHQLRIAQQGLEQRNSSLQVMALNDGLTGLANRRHFEESMIRELSRAERSGANLSVVLLDVDFFKKYNDSYGHVAGDDCLRNLALAIAAGANRPADLAVRYGGEEFAVILPNTDLDGALAVAENIRLAVAALALPHVGNPPGVVTISAGVHSAQPTRDNMNSAMFVKLADQALYEAKSGGRNRVVGRAGNVHLLPGVG